MRFASELSERRAASGSRSEPAAGAPAATPSEWEGRFRDVFGALVGWLTRPHVRAVLVGVVLIVLAITVLDHSVWTLPLLIVGLVMVIVAWVGRRLEGRFAIEWGEDGAGFEMRARFKASEPAPAARASSAALPEAPLPAIEGEAHTVEIDVVELRALIDAAQRREAA